MTLTSVYTITDQMVTGAVNNFSGVEAQDTGTIALATYMDPNTLATVANEHATLPPNGWGDGTPGSAVTLTVSQIGVDSATGDPIFRVFGNHKYAEEGAFTVNIIITTLDGTTTILTPGTATIVDAALSSSNGTEITDIEGEPSGTILLGTFRDDNQAATVADFTTAPGSTVVNWGDGSAPETLTAADLAAVGSPNGVIWTVSAAHTYAEGGTYAYTVTVTDDGGAVTIFGGSAIIADAPLTPVPACSRWSAPSKRLSSRCPCSRHRSSRARSPRSPTATRSRNRADFSALIDWGDGTPMTAGTWRPAGGAGTLSSSAAPTPMLIPVSTAATEPSPSRCSSRTTTARD